MRLLAPLFAVLVLVGLAAVGAEAGLHVLFGVVVPYLALALFVVGVIWRLLAWARVPVPFRIPTTCGQQKTLPWIKQDKLENPFTTMQVVGRMALEVLFFRSLFRNSRVEKQGSKVAYADSKWLWLGAIVFHYGFLVVVLRHVRLFTEPVPAAILGIQELDGFFQIGVPVLYLTTLALLAGVSYLLIRRLFVPQVRYISLANDYFPLFLLLGIAITGILLRHFVKTDIVAVKELAVSLATFSPAIAAAPLHYLVYVHLFLVSVLIAYFPFSKLMHAGGVFMSPTRNLASNNRAVRHVNPWNHPVKVHTYEEYEDDFRDKMKGAGIPVEKE
jgi:nitrate reductase gamma subunit